VANKPSHAVMKLFLILSTSFVSADLLYKMTVFPWLKRFHAYFPHAYLKLSRLKSETSLMNPFNTRRKRQHIDLEPRVIRIVRDILLQRFHTAYKCVLVD
jgi:hypothetical protein